MAERGRLCPEHSGWRICPWHGQRGCLSSPRSLSPLLLLFPSSSVPWEARASRGCSAGCPGQWQRGDHVPKINRWEEPWEGARIAGSLWTVFHHPPSQLFRILPLHPCSSFPGAVLLVGNCSLLTSMCLYPFLFAGKGLVEPLKGGSSFQSVLL